MTTAAEKTAAADKAADKTAAAEKNIIEAARRSQHAFLQLWSDGVHRFFGLLPATETKTTGTDGARTPSVPSDEEVVDHAFDYADSVLAVQRAWFKNVAAANKSFASSTAWMAQGADRGATSKKS